MPARVRSERFVGREREITRIAVALEAAADGRSRRILASGPGGIGVSRLVDESIRRVGRLAEPFSILRWRSVAGRSGEPYAPAIEGLRPFLGGLTDVERRRILGPGSEALGPLLPPGAGVERPAGVVPLRVSADRRAAWLAEAVLGMLERASEQRPVLLVLEDLHLADAATRDLAVFLCRVARPSRLCIIATYGTDRLVHGHPLLGDLASIADAADPPERLDLQPLRRDELADLVAAIEGARPTASRLLLAAERSGGNPLLVEEVLAARRELSGVSLGSSLDELIAARLALRSPECRRTLRLLALAGEPMRREALQHVATAFEADAVGLPPRSTGRPRHGADGLDADLRAGLDEGIETAFVTVQADETVEIRHELVAMAIAADLLPNQRRRYHVAFATSVADRPGARARHWLSAHETQAARNALLEASAAALAVGAAADQLAMVELALELGAAETGDRALTGRLLLDTADVALAAGRPDRALAYLESAASRFAEREDRALMAGLHERLGRVARSLGDHDRALSEHRRAASLAPAGSSGLRARVLGSLAQTLMLEGHFAEAETIARQAIDVARTVGVEARAAEGHATCTLGIARAWGAAPADAIGLLERARDIAAEVGDADDWFRATLNLTTALTLLHRGEEAINATMDAIERARRDGVEAVYGNALRGNVAEALFLTGRWAEARDGDHAARLLGRRLLELRNAPDPQSVVPASRAAASFALWRGDLGDASRAAELGWSAVRDSEDWVQAARTAATYLEVQAAIVADAHDRRALAELAEARQNATRTLAQAEAILRSSGVPADAASRGEAEAQLATARGYAARIDGRDSADQWAAIAASWDALGDPYQVARARWRQAEAALPAKDAREGRAIARGPLLEAVRIARELGAGPLLRNLEELARRALITLPSVPATEPPGGPAAVMGSGPGSAASLVPAGPISSGMPGSPGTTNGHGPRPREVAIEPRAAGGIAEAFVGPPEARPDAAFGLSNREREVLSLIVLGRTNREIGERLFISQKTVGVHVGNILSKLGVSGRVEAAMVAVRLELVPNRG
ncbi:MAG: Helix-turn-helix transcriptional regulator [Chloroflexi bacterium]|nr:Helix-turn-helix transcriptional regulator [Chloroflexota bacterium]